MPADEGIHNDPRGGGETKHPPQKQRKIDQAYEPLSRPISIESAISDLRKRPRDQAKAALDLLVADYGVEAAKEWRGSTKHAHTLLHELVYKPEAIEHAVAGLGFDMNLSRSSDGCTPMHLAVWQKQYETLEVLRKLGADSTIKNKYGETVTELIRVRDSCSNIVWLDLELASLDDPTILECAVIITNAQLEELGRGHWVVHMDQAAREQVVIGGTASEFHSKNSAMNGLFEAMEESTTTKSQMAQQLLALIKLHCPQSKTCPLGGSSVHCDRDVLKSEAPEVYAHLSHQIVDVSTMTSLMHRWLPKKLRRLHDARDEGNHRAMADIECSLNTTKWMREHLFKLDDEAIE